jgi:hypothetical protein
MKDPKTTTVAIIGGLVLLICVLGLVFKTLDLTTFTAVLATTATFCGTLIGLFAKDGNSTPPQA